MTAAMVPGQASGRAPGQVSGLTVLYDERCGVCRWARRWLSEQRQLVPLAFVPAGSEEAVRRLPALDHRRTLAEVTVVGDGGQVFADDRAWIACLWALADYRELAVRLSSPALLPFARSAILVVSRFRAASSDYGDACEPARQR
jgi:predicted DCC family thiol-disulfide oxidoreductase YuxK